MHPEPIPMSKIFNLFLFLVSKSVLFPIPIQVFFNIGKLAKIWLDIQDDNGMCESNYGCYLLGDQWHWVVSELLNDRDSRRATIVINQPYHKGKNKKDYPCTQYVHFFIRDNKLHLGVNMRSNDAVFGFCNDVFTFCMFQQYTCYSSTIIISLTCACICNTQSCC